jgi:glucose-1-phosphate adenylyltransferase
VDTTVLGLTPEEAAQKPFIASMGIYVFKKGVLGAQFGWHASFTCDVLTFLW